MRKVPVIARAAAVGGLAAAVAARRARAHPLQAVSLVALAAAAGWSTFAPRSPGFGRVPWRGPRTGTRMALTFDDGPSASTPAILDALAAHGAHATFFVLGRQARAFPDVIARMHAEGHQVANHGDDHGILAFRGPAHVRRQLATCEDAVARAAGPGAMSRLFRAPHGFRGPATTAAARSAGYRTVAWTHGVFDSDEPGVDVIVQRCNDVLYPGCILLLHDADGWCPDRPRPQTAQAVPRVLAEASRRGLDLVTLDELLEPST